MTTCNPSCLKKLCQWGMVTFEDFMSTPAEVMIWLLKIEFEHYKSCFVGFLGWVVHAMNSIVLRTGPNSRVQPEQRAQKRKRPLQLKLRIRITDYGPDLRGSPAADRTIFFYLSAHHCWPIKSRNSYQFEHWYLVTLQIEMRWAWENNWNE